MTPNSRYLYESRTHREAKSSLMIGLECGVGFQALIAPPGMGKTTLLSHILQQFRKSALAISLFQVQGGSSDFLEYLLSELGSRSPTSSPARAQDAINRLLVAQFRNRRPVIIVIDEAQHLDLEVMETIRMLSNFETSSEKLLHIIFSGQPQLAANLANPQLAQLRQRISIFATLKPFDRADTEQYIEHRLALAGHSGSGLFTPDSVTMLWEHSKGVPRNVNSLCFNALLIAASTNSRHVDELTISEVLKDRSLNLLAFPLSHGTSTSNVDSQATATGKLETKSLPLVEAYDNTRLSPEVVTTLTRLRILVEERQLSNRTILQMVSEAAQNLTGADGAAIAVQEDSLFVCRARTGNVAPELGCNLDVNTGISGRCLRTGKPQLCEDTHTDLDVDSDLCRHLGLRSIAVVPMRKQTATLGVLEVFSKHPGAFEGQHLNLLTQLADLVHTAQNTIGALLSSTDLQAVGGTHRRCNAIV